jgi:hypothetical protein
MPWSSSRASEPEMVDGPLLLVERGALVIVSHGFSGFERAAGGLVGALDLWCRARVGGSTYVLDYRLNRDKWVFLDGKLYSCFHYHMHALWLSK